MTGAARLVTTEDHERLVRDHEMVLEQLAAADAVLVALGRSSSAADADAVLVTMAESARRLCRCQGVTIYLLHGEEFELAATVGLSPGVPELRRRAPTSPGSGDDGRTRRP